MSMVKLVIQLLGLPSKSGRIPVNIFTDFNQYQKYSIDVRRIKKAWEVHYCYDEEIDRYFDKIEIRRPRIMLLFIVEYETPHIDYELYKRSNEFALRLLSRGKMFSPGEVMPLPDMRKGDVWIAETPIVYTKKSVPHGLLDYVSTIVVDIKERIIKVTTDVCDADDCEPVSKRIVFRW